MRRKPKALNEIHNEYIEENHSDVDKMYKVIRIRYDQLIKEEGFNITKERIRLYKKFNRCTGQSFKDTMSMFMIMLTSAVGISFQYEISKADNKALSIIGLFIAIVIMAFIIGFTNGKIFVKEKNEPIYYEICLKALEELEKENNKE